MNFNKLILQLIVFIVLIFTGCKGDNQNILKTKIKGAIFFDIEMGGKVDNRFQKQKDNLYCMNRTDDFETACVILDSSERINKIILYKKGDFTGYNYANNIFQKLSAKYSNLSCEKYFHYTFRNTQVGVVCNTFNDKINIKFELSGKPNAGAVTDIDDYMRLSYTLVNIEGI